jgi:adenylyltransferase/sulfurtransferase
MQEITVLELKRKLDEQQPVVLVDVREPEERAVSHIGGYHIPLANLPSQIWDLEEYKESEIVVYCRSGARSANAVGYMLQMGFKKVYNLKGGMKAWKNEVDNSIEVA